MKLGDLFDYGVPASAGAIDITGLTADSRKVKPGFLFAALKGVAAHGRDFVDQAKTNGAVAVLSAGDLGFDPGIPEVVTEEPRKDFIWDMKLNQTRWCAGVFVRRKLNRLLSLNTGILYFRIQGSDINSENPARVGRNPNFRNDMLEWYLRGEFTLFQDNDMGGRGRYRTDFRLFGYAGIAAYLSNPQGQYQGPTTADLTNGEWVSLRPIKTELVDYSNIGVAIPVGIGFHFMNGLFSHLGLLNTWPAWMAAGIPSLAAVILALGMLAWVDRAR